MPLNFTELLLSKMSVEKVDTSAAPEHCPGPESERAGLDSACAGCPNQEICQSSPQNRGPDPDIPLIVEALKNVKNKILVLSGKGGVGKSTFTALLASMLASEDEDGDEDCQVGVIDLDFCGPSLARIMGTENKRFFSSASGWTPAYKDSNLGVVSIASMLPANDEPVIWRGDKKTGLIKQFLKNVDWGEDGLDYLIIDTPPGTSDEHISLAQYLHPAGEFGALVVTTPQETALQDVRKELDFCKKAGIRVYGVVENMAGFVCPSCNGKSDIFIPSRGGGGRTLAYEAGVPFLGGVPLDPRVGRCCDEGADFLEEYPNSPAAEAIRAVLHELMNAVG